MPAHRSAPSRAASASAIFAPVALSGGSIDPQKRLASEKSVCPWRTSVMESMRHIRMSGVRSVSALLPLLAWGCSGFHAVGDGGVDAGPASTLAVVQEIPDAGSLNAVWGSGPNDVHAVGD